MPPKKKKDNKAAGEMAEGEDPAFFLSNYNKFTK